MKNLYKVIIAIVAVIGFSFAACGDDGGGTAAAPQSVTYISKDGDGNIYTLEITENTKRSARYAANEGDDFKFTVELFKDGTYTVALTVSGKVESGSSGVNINITVNDKPLNITVSGTDMTVISGTIVLDNNEEITFGKWDTLTALNTPEELPEAKRWWKWVTSTTATVDYSVDRDGVCTVNVGGKAEPNNETDGWYRWKAQAGYSYTGKADKSYDYTFEAWTQSGARGLNVQYYTDNDESVYFNKTVEITNTRKTYTIKGRALPKGVENSLQFHCADQLGTFYVKILSITEVNGRVDKTITITGITGKNGINVLLRVESDDKFVAWAWGGEVSGNSATVSFIMEEVVDDESTGDAWFGSGPYYLRLLFHVNDEWVSYDYTNGQPSAQKYNITSATTTIGFDKFATFSEEGGGSGNTPPVVGGNDKQK
jgi:hypothetical protein